MLSFARVFVTIVSWIPSKIKGGKRKYFQKKKFFCEKHIDKFNFIGYNRYVVNKMLV